MLISLAWPDRFSPHGAEELLVLHLLTRPENIYISQNITEAIAMTKTIKSHHQMGIINISMEARVFNSISNQSFNKKYCVSTVYVSMVRVGVVTLKT